MAEQNHTPTPWGYWMGLKAYGEHGVITDNSLGRHIAYLAGGAPNPELDAAFIVRAVNCHDAMIDALEELEWQAELSLDYRPEFRRAIAKAHAALALAKE